MNRGKLYQEAKSVAGILVSQGFLTTGMYEYSAGHPTTAGGALVASALSAAIHVHGVNRISIHNIEKVAEDVFNSVSGSEMVHHSQVKDKRDITIVNGVGSNTADDFKKQGVSTVGDIVSVSAVWLSDMTDNKYSPDKIRSLQDEARALLVKESS